jgi:predicted dehydrogenase
MTVRVAVIGVGFFGSNHARHLASLPDAKLVAVVDAHETTARRVANDLHTRALSDPSELVGQVDAVCVCVPTIAHFAVARPFLCHGIPTFVEKPLALSADEAGEMVRLSQQHRALLQVGHIERYNPVWSAVEEAGMVPTFVEARRFSPYPFRSLDVSVVFDVMIHDLDLALAAIGAPVTSVEGVGSRVVSPTYDRADVWLGFSNGARAGLSASRVYHAVTRSMRLVDDHRSVELDFLNRTSLLSSIRDEPLPGVSPAASREVKQALWSQWQSTQPTVHERSADPLRDELADFLRCIRQGQRPRVCGEMGYAVVCLAVQIERAIAQSRPARWRHSA